MNPILVFFAVNLLAKFNDAAPIVNSSTAQIAAVTSVPAEEPTTIPEAELLPQSLEPTVPTTPLHPYLNAEKMRELLMAAPARSSISVPPADAIPELMDNLETLKNASVFHELTRLSKLTDYMLVDPKFAEDYRNGNMTELSRILYVVYGDIVKHIYASELLTQRAPPTRRNRLRYRMKSLNNLPPKQCSESGRRTMRLFCPFSYGYQWWDCLMPEEVCDGVPHCGLGDDEDPKMCLYFKAAVARLGQGAKTSSSVQQPQVPLEVYNPE